MLRFPRAYLAAAMFTMAAPAFAILPQTGMWSIGSELNGKPGRGIQIDRQGGELLILTYFGYRPDGSATFMQASGKLTDGMLFSGDLIEYKNGRAIDGEARDGEVAQVIGTISIKFDSTSSGTVTLPRQAPQRFSRYVFEDHLARLNGRFHYQMQRREHGTAAQTQAIFRAAPGQLSITLLDESGCIYKGDLRPTGDTFSSKGEWLCSSVYALTMPPTVDEIIDIKVDENGMFTARAYKYWLNGANAATKNDGMVLLEGKCVLPKNDGQLAFAASRCGPGDLNISPLTPVDFIP